MIRFLGQRILMKLYWSLLTKMIGLLVHWITPVIDVKMDIILMIGSVCNARIHALNALTLTIAQPV